MQAIRRTSFPVNNAEKSNGKDTKSEIKANHVKPIPTSIFSADNVDKKIKGYADYAMSEKSERPPGDISWRNTDTSTKYNGNSSVAKEQ